MLKKRSKQAWKAAEDQIDEVVKNPGLGEALEDEWEGARSLHFGNDAYRLIWEVDSEADLIIVLRVGKKQRRAGTIYIEPRPVTEQWPPGGSEGWRPLS